MGAFIKRYIFLLLIFLSAASLFPFGLELYTGGDIGQAFTGSGKLKLSLGELRFSLCDQKYNFGITATNKAFSKKLPFYLKAGNLSLAGILSKMNSPQLSASALPFSAGVASVSPVSISGFSVVTI